MMHKLVVVIVCSLISSAIAQACEFAPIHSNTKNSVALGRAIGSINDVFIEDCHYLQHNDDSIFGYTGLRQMGEVSFREAYYASEGAVSFIGYAILKASHDSVDSLGSYYHVETFSKLGEDLLSISRILDDLEKCEDDTYCFLAFVRSRVSSATRRNSPDYSELLEKLDSKKPRMAFSAFSMEGDQFEFLASIERAECFSESHWFIRAIKQTNGELNITEVQRAIR